MLGEVLARVLGVNTLLALLPVGRADLTMLSSELEGLELTKGLGDVTTNGGVVDGDGLDNSLGIDDEDTTKSDTLLLDEDTVVTAQTVVGVSHEGKRHLAETTLIGGSVVPGQQAELGVGRSKQNFSTLLSEFLKFRVVGNNFSRADKSEGQRNKGKDNPLALVLIQGDFLENTVNDSSLLESGCGVTNSCNHFLD